MARFDRTSFEARCRRAAARAKIVIDDPDVEGRFPNVVFRAKGIQGYFRRSQALARRQ